MNEWPEWSEEAGLCPEVLAVAAKPTREKIAGAKKGVLPPVRRLLEYFDQHLFDPLLTVNRAKAACGLGSNAATYFHQQLGITPRRFLTGCRLEIARRLIENTRAQLRDIGSAVGFASLSAFSDIYKYHIGESPIKTRRRFWANKPRDHRAATAVIRRALRGELSQTEARSLVQRLEKIYFPRAPAP